MEENPYKAPISEPDQRSGDRSVLYPAGCLVSVLGFLLMVAFINSFDVDARNPWKPHQWAGFAAFTTGFFVVASGCMACLTQFLRGS